MKRNPCLVLLISHICTFICLIIEKFPHMGVFGYGGSNQWGGPYCSCILKLSVDAEALPSQNKIEISSFLKMSLLRTMI